MASVGTFLLSKEIWILDHEFYTGVAMLVVLGGLVNKVGPGFTKAIHDELDADEARYKAIRQDEIDR